VRRQLDERPDIAARARLLGDSKRLLIVLVGLPARGKSIIAHKLDAFLNWRGWRTKAFSAGATRRRLQGGEGSAASFFDSSSSSSHAAREQISLSVLQEALAFFDDGGDIAIFDASNSSKSRRATLSRRVAEHGAASSQPIGIVFVESILTSPTLLLANMQAKVRASPDFYGHAGDEAAAMDDLKRRAVHYEASYQSLAEHEGAFIQLYDLSSKVVASNVYGRMSSSVLPFLLALHFMPRPLAFVSVPADGAPTFDLCAALARWASTHEGPLQVLSSTHPAAIDAAAAVYDAKRRENAKYSEALPALGPPCHLVELQPSAVGADDRPPATLDERRGGESCADLVRRLEASVLEIEKRLAPILVVAHQAPCRALRAYLRGLPLAESMHASSSDGARALADGAGALLLLTPTAKTLGFAESVVSLEGVGGSVPAGGGP